MKSRVQFDKMQLLALIPFRHLCCMFLIVFSAILTSAQVQEGVPCETPDAQYGLCVNIKSCGVLINLLRTQSNVPSVRTFLRSSTCGYIGNTPMVCCPQPKPNPNPFDEAGKNIPVGDDPDVVSNEDSNYRLLRPPNCGKGNATNARIVGGVPAALGQFPWIVALGYRNKNNPNQPKWLCGGSLITTRHVLTAGHCVHNRNDLYVARVGDLDLFSDNDGANPETIPLIQAKIHENYSPVKFTSDIAILTMAREPSIAGVWPICLPAHEPLRSNRFVTAKPIVAGWGAIYFNGPSSSILRLVPLPVVDNELCKQAFGNKSVIDDRILCAGLLKGGKDACQGDSGGPLMYGHNEDLDFYFYQIGVVSYGFRCAEAGYPGVYTRVTAFIDWINQNIN